MHYDAIKILTLPGVTRSLHPLLLPCLSAVGEFCNEYRCSILEMNCVWMASKAKAIGKCDAFYRIRDFEWSLVLNSVIKSKKSIGN